MDVATAKPHMASPQAAPGGPKQTTIAEPGETPARVVVSCCLEQGGWPQAVTCLAASRSALAVGGNSGSIRCGPHHAACGGGFAPESCGGEWFLQPVVLCVFLCVSLQPVLAALHL